MHIVLLRVESKEVREYFATKMLNNWVDKGMTDKLRSEFYPKLVAKLRYDYSQVEPETLRKFLRTSVGKKSAATMKIISGLQNQILFNVKAHKELKRSFEMLVLNELEKLVM